MTSLVVAKWGKDMPEKGDVWRSPFGLLAAIFLAIASPAGADIAEEFAIAGWQGIAYRDSGGAFALCNIARSDGAGGEISFGIRADMTWFMGLGHAEWSLQPGNRLDLAYALDGDAETAAAAQVLSHQGLAVDFPDDQALFRRFQYGADLRIAAHDRLFRFDLTGARRAFDELLACTRRWAAGGLGKNRNAFSSPVQPIDWTEPPDPIRMALAGEARGLVARIIAGAGIGDYSLLTGNDLQDTLPGYHAGWVTNATIAGILVAPSPDRLAASLAEEFMRADKHYCRGDFAAEWRSSRPESRPSLIAARFASFCRDSEDDLAGYYTILDRAAGGFYVLIVMGRIAADGGDPAILADLAVQDALPRLRVQP